MSDPKARSLRLLVVEDRPEDAELMLRELRRAGFAPDWERVDTEAGFVAGLRPELDIILSDFTLPDFSGPRALELLRARALDIPFILVSGTIGEEVAVEAMRQGASDYLLKDRLARLGPAVEHAIDQRRLRKESEHAEKSMRESEHKYRHLFESLSEPAFLIECESRRILDANICAQKLLGRTRTEILGKDAWTLLPAAAAPETVSPATTIPECRGGLEEAEVLTGDGSRVPVLVSVAPVDLYGRSLILALLTDITARKQAEDILRESERRFREMLENIALIAMTLDTTGTVTFCNDCLLEITGWTHDEVVGSEWWEKFTPGDPQAKQRYLNIMATGEFPAHRENSIMTRDGRLRDIAWSRTLLRDAEGGILGAAYIGEDVTERNRASERIREQAAMLDQAYEAIINYDIRTRRVTYWNQGAERLYGRSADEAKGREIGPLIFAAPAVTDTITEHLLTTGEWRGECRQRTGSGRELIANAHATLMRDAAGVPKSALVINIDITAQKHLEEQLIRSQRMESIGSLVGGIAHDFNNVLSPIMMAVGVLKSRLPDAASQELLAVLTASARRGADMVRQILLVGSGAGGTRQIEVNLKPLLLQIEKIANETFLKQVEVRVDVPDDLWTVTGDPTQLHQMLLNLCVNAREAMADGGTLALSAENLTLDAHYASMNSDARAGQYVLIQVMDSGTGMPPEILGQIFDPFFSTKAAGDGTGLGLSTSLSIVRNHGGFIRVESEPGQGSRFRIYLPARTNFPTPSAAEEDRDLPHGNGELILVVDDEAFVGEINQQTLEAFGYRVILASDGVEAVAAYASRHDEIAAVIMDMVMPEMDGPSAIKILKSINPDVRIIAASGFVASEHAAAASGLGVRHFLAKPYTAGTLLTTIREILREA